MAKTYATFNPSDKGANMTLSNGNKTVTAGTGTWETIRATLGKSSGKWYWEMVVGNVVNSSNPMLGISLSSVSVNGYASSSANGYQYWEYNGNKINNNSFVAYGSAFVAGDVIGIALDMDNGTITCYKNNVSQGVMYTGLSGTFYPTVSVNVGGGVAGVVTANFGATALTYTPPTGYNAGIYTGADDAYANVLLALI